MAPENTRFPIRKTGVLVWCYFLLIKFTKSSMTCNASASSHVWESAAIRVPEASPTLLVIRMHQSLVEPQTAGLSASKMSSEVGSVISSIASIAAWMVSNESQYAESGGTQYDARFTRLRNRTDKNYPLKVRILLGPRILDEKQRKNLEIN